MTSTIPQPPTNGEPGRFCEFVGGKLDGSEMFIMDSTTVLQHPEINGERYSPEPTFRSDIYRRKLGTNRFVFVGSIY